MKARQKVEEVHAVLGDLLTEMRTYPPSVPPAVYRRVEQIRDSCVRQEKS